MEDKEIKNYVNRFPVTAWAAAYAASELYVLGMINKISGSLTGLTHGLPLEFLIPLLKKSGYQPRP
jgi:predicted house-cleaning NTP pyrophosphatase (Maf/HAM1 superfamily)